MNPRPDVLELARLLEPSWPDITRRIVRSGAPTCLQSSDTTSRLKQQLAEIEAQTTDLRDQRADAQRALDRASGAFAASSAPLDTSSKEFRDAKAARERIGKIDTQLAKLHDQHIATLRVLGGSEGSVGAFATEAPPFPANQGWNASRVLNDSTREDLSRMAGTSMPLGRLALGEVASRETFAAGLSGGGGAMMADVAGTTAMRRGDWVGVTPQLRRRLRIADLLPIGFTDGNSVPYTQESGSFTTAAETVEGAVKPEAAVTYTDKTADVATIAHWLKNRKQVLADVPALQSILEGRLRYGVERRLEDEILAGDGTGENIEGILATSGIGSVPYDAGELPADQILTGVTQVFLADGEANAIVMNPTDWAGALKVKADGDGHYYSGGPFSVTPQIMWGVPLLPSAAVAQGTALVGDFALGAQLFIRDGVQVLISDSDGDDFTRNRITILAEMRAALAVWRPAVFSVVDLAA